MRVRSWLPINLWVVLLLLFGGIGHALSQEPSPGESSDDFVTPAVTPTKDRLAAPPTVASPTQADVGAQLFWLWCQPCHGDQGQGLTDEWRAQYPEDHQNCWASGCHGNIPYEDGFTLPRHVPAVIGDQSLQRFQTMGELYEYVHLKMPYEFPGALSSEEALAVTAYLARAHGKWEDVQLTEENVQQKSWRPLPTATPQAVGSASERPANRDSAPSMPLYSWANAVPLLGAFFLGVAVLGGIWIWRRGD
jgi:hypothetical protein